MDKLNIGLWKKPTGNLMSHGAGLSEEQVKALQELKVGDRLIVYSNNNAKDNQPNFTIKIYKKSVESEAKEQ